MNRRAILGLITGGATGLWSRFASAGNSNPGSPTAVGLPAGTGAAGGAHGKAAKRNSGFPDLKLAGPDHQVHSIAYSLGAYRVTTADGRSAHFLEADLRFKLDSSDVGPHSGAPVILPAGTEGDRAWVFFASPAEISRFIKPKWS